MKPLLEASQFLLARWVLPVSGPAVENGCLALNEKKIAGVVSRREFEGLPLKARAGRSIDLGEAVITPGLLNLHTHLDYSALKHMDNYAPFFQWMTALIKSTWHWSGSKWFESALSGAQEVISSGTSMVADSSYSGAAARAVACSGLRGIVGLELFGLRQEDADKNFSAWLSKYDRFHSEAEPQVKEAIESGRLKITVAPHTPYTVCPVLIGKALDWCRERNLPMFIHIAESEVECSWIASGHKELDAFFKSIGQNVSKTDWRGHGLSPVRHMEKHKLLDSHVLAAHLVKLSEQDIETLVSHNVSAVHCPRSNSRLGNGVAPLASLIKSGLRLGLGTDSAASSDDLNVLAEARFAWNLHRSVDSRFRESAEKALFYLTLGAAQALNQQELIGSLDPGKKADFAVFSLAHLPELARKRPHECLIYGGAELKALAVDGKYLFQDDFPSADSKTNV